DGNPASPFTTIGPNTNLVGGYIGDGGVGLPATTPDPDSIVAAQFSGFPINVYTAASNLGGNSPAGSIAGGPVPTGTLDDVAGTITMDLSSWFFNWNDSDLQAGTGKADGVTSTFATGVWDPVSGLYTLSWQSLTGLGPTPGLVTFISLSGVASPVPVPAAAWLFGSGLLSLVGISRRRKKAA
ncbi:MAG: VPLPA-CTERM sorting domain-containing protein, partial [Acidiferrobacterales bacterium]